MRVREDEIYFEDANKRATRSSGIELADYLLVSSTSWTEDEDFGILLGAMEIFDTAMKKRETLGERMPVSVLLIITGRGPLKEFYLKKMKSLNLKYVRIKTAWLSAEDYPLLLGMSF